MKLRSSCKDPARRFFAKDLTDRERAVFEAGIALGMAFHQFVGIPIAGRKLELRTLERAIENAICNQPFKERARVRIKLVKRKGSRGVYSYGILLPSMMDIEVDVKYGKAYVKACMKTFKELKGYPLMYISQIR